MAIAPRQLDFFVALPSAEMPIKSAQDLMARAWFSLSKDKRTKPIEHPNYRSIQISQGP